MKFRKKPVVIDAAQWFKHGDHPAVVAVPQSEHLKIGWNHPDNFGWVPTLEGGHVVTPGDWIIKGVKGEHYPCKPDVFAATYEPVNGSNVRDERETLTSVGADARTVSAATTAARIAAAASTPRKTWSATFAVARAASSSVGAPPRPRR